MFLSSQRLFYSFVMYGQFYIVSTNSDVCLLVLACYVHDRLGRERTKRTILSLDFWDLRARNWVYIMKLHTIYMHNVSMLFLYVFLSRCNAFQRWGYLERTVYCKLFLFPHLTCNSKLSSLEVCTYVPTMS